MTSTHSQEILSAAGKFSNDLISTARSDVAAKLKAVDEACCAILKGGGTVSIGSVRGWLITNRGLSIAPSTLMNLRTDPRTGEKKHSPARRIIKKYIEVQELPSKRTIKPAEHHLASFAFDESEMREIKDHQVRYKVQLLVGRVRNLETQLNHVRTISNLPELAAENVPQNHSLLNEDPSVPIGDGDAIRLDEAEREALHDFLNDNSMHRRKIGFDENGALKATHPANPSTSTTAISKPFLKGALHKILRAHRRDILS